MSLLYHPTDLNDTVSVSVLYSHRMILKNPILRYILFINISDMLQLSLVPGACLAGILGEAIYSPYDITGSNFKIIFYVLKNQTSFTIQTLLVLKTLTFCKAHHL